MWPDENIKMVTGINVTPAGSTTLHKWDRIELWEYKYLQNLAVCSMVKIISLCHKEPAKGPSRGLWVP